MTAQPECYSVQAALCSKRIAPIANKSEEANQIAVPAWEHYFSARQCAVWTQCTGGWCWDLGTYKRSLESSHCSSHRQRYSTVPLWVRLWKIWSLPQLLVTFGGVPLFELQLISSLSLLAFEHLTPKWELINTCSFYAALGNNPVKEELSPFAVLSLEKIAKALHETQEHHVFVVKEYVK